MAATKPRACGSDWSDEGFLALNFVDRATRASPPVSGGFCCRLTQRADLPEP